MYAEKRESSNSDLDEGSSTSTRTSSWESSRESSTSDGEQECKAASSKAKQLPLNAKQLPLNAKQLPRKGLDYRTTSSGKHVNQEDYKEKCENCEHMKAKRKKSKEKKQVWKKKYEELLDKLEEEKEYKRNSAWEMGRADGVNYSLRQQLHDTQQTVEDYKEDICKTEKEMKQLQIRVDDLKQQVEQLKFEKDSQSEASLQLELEYNVLEERSHREKNAHITEVGKMKKAIVSAKIKITNLRKINSDLEDQDEQKTAQLATADTYLVNLRGDLATSRTESDNLRRVRDELQGQVMDLVLRQQLFEQQEEDNQVLFDELGHIADGVLQYQHGVELILAPETVDIIILTVHGIYDPH